MKTSLKYVIVLTVICAVSAALLAVVHEITRQPIAESRDRQTMEAVETVLPAAETILDAAEVRAALGGGDGLPEIYAAFSEGELVGAAVKVTDPAGYGGDVTYMVGVNADGTVNAIRLLQHKETPGLGTKVGDEEFTDQFRGLEVPADGLLLDKDGGTIQSITGATISARTAANAAQQAVEAFLEHAADLKGLGRPMSLEGVPTEGGRYG